MSEDSPRVKPEGRDVTRPKGRSFVRVPLDVMAIRDLSTNAKIVWVVLQGWTWNGRSPSNSQIANGCGWVDDEGVKSIDKVKRALRELEAAGLIERDIRRKGWIDRPGIQVNRVFETGGGATVHQARRKDHPSKAQGSPSDSGAPLPYTSDRSRSQIDSDRLRSPDGGGEEARQTTTTNAAPPAEVPTPGVLAKQPRAASVVEAPSATYPEMVETIVRTKAACPSPTPPQPTRRPEPRPCPPVVNEATPAESGEEPPRPWREPRPTIAATGDEAPPVAEADLNAIQRAFLDGLSSEERTRFDGWKPGKRAADLAALALDFDGSIARHVMSLLRPSSRMASRPIPDVGWVASDLIEALASGDREAVPALASRLAIDFKDAKSQKYYVSICQSVIAGEREIEAIADAYRQATGPKANDPGAVFTHAIKRSDARNRQLVAV